MSWSKTGPQFYADTLLQGAARAVVTDVNQFFSRERLERAAMSDERVRLARELHDGVLQSLTGVALQLEALSRLIAENPDAAKERLRVIGDLLAEEQRDLRSWIQKLAPTGRPPLSGCIDLVGPLENLCKRVESQWGLQVELHPGNARTISDTLADEVYRLVQEALTNAGRHSRAQWVRVELEMSRDRVYVTVADDGQGYPYHGRYVLEALLQGKLGPVSLKHRIASLGGDLVLTSDYSGSRLEMSLPFVRSRGWDAASRFVDLGRSDKS